MKDFNGLRDRAYRNACEHGFHDEEYSYEHLLCLVISELMEAVQADRKGIIADKVEFENIIKANKEYFPEDEQSLKFRIEYNNRIKNSLEDELADSCIRLFDLAGHKGCDIRTDECSNIMLSRDVFTSSIYHITQVLCDGSCTVSCKVNHALSLISALADFMNIDLMWFIEIKMKYNETRPYKHGCKY